METVTPPPQPPPKPPTPAQLPAKPPEVILEDRQLWILADNSTLGDILNLVRTRTGAVIEVTSGDVSERVMGRFGPGPARDVLSALLNGSHFNYVLTSPGDDPTGLSHVVLIPKPAGGAGAVASGGGQVFQGAAPQVYRAPAPVYSPPPQAAAQVPPPEAEQPADDQSDQATDGLDADQAQQGQGENGEQQGTQPTVKTPEQLLQELQKQQQLLLQQQRQQQQQQGSNDQQPDSQDPQD